MSHPLFKTSNELTFNTVQSDRKRIMKYLQALDADVFSLDLSEVTQCDSAGLALLIESKRQCKIHDKIFEIEHMPKSIYALAEFCGVDAILCANIVNEVVHDKQ